MINQYLEINSINQFYAFPIEIISFEQYCYLDDFEN
jgi:hypothetical protein